MAAAPAHNDLTTAEIADALQYIPANCDRDYWVRIGMAVKAELGDGEGWPLFDAWSQSGDNYNAADARDTWRSIKAGGGVNIGTLLREAMQNGFSLRTEDRKPLPPQDIEARQRRQAEDKARDEAERKRRRVEAATRAAAMWEAAEPADIHPYLSRKGVRAYDLRVGTMRDRPALLIPIRNGHGKLVSLQGIYDGVQTDLKGAPRDRDFLPGGELRGCFHMIPGDDTAPIAVCEGYATGASIRQATGWRVAVAFVAGNLADTAEAVRKAHMGARIIVAADNDLWTDGNPGMHAARLAVSACKGTMVAPRFADMAGKPTDFNDLHAREGIDAVLQQLRDSAPNVANDNEPFRVLGYDRDTFYFFQNEKRQLVRLSTGAMSEANLFALAPMMWWVTHYPKKDGAFDKQVAVDTLIRDAYRAGVYDPARVRGRGAWTDDGRVVFHFGSHLMVDGQQVSVEGLASDHVYEVGRTLAKLSDAGLTDAEGAGLVEISRMFRWTKPASGALMAGYVALAPLCGALRWRPHVWITGGAGCGKTTVLNEYVHRLMGGMDVFAQGNSTEAGIRQTLRGDALPVLFDESEQNNDREASRVQNVLSLIRQASSESAAQTLKGTAGGEAMHFNIRSMFCLSSIQVGIKHQADIERLTVLTLRPKHEDDQAADTWGTLRERLHLMARDKDLPARLFRRSLDLLPVTLRNVETFTEAATRRFGSVREGDQYGTLLAGCWSMMHSTLATPDQARALIDSYDWGDRQETAVEDDSRLALVAMMEAQLRTSSGATLSVYQAVKAAMSQAGMAPVPAGEAKEALERHGMRLAANHLLLSNSSTALANLVKGTQYHADLRGLLLRVEGVHRHDKAVRIAGAVSKCIAVPLGVIGVTGEAEDRPF